MIVLIAVMEKQVVITDNFNPAEITGRQSIFNRSSAHTELKMEVEIVGAYTRLEDTNNARAHHMATHPGRRYVQKVCHLDDKLPGPVEPPTCIKCGVPIGPVGSFCGACQQQHYRECMDLDPRHGEGDITPLVKVNRGGPNAIAHDGTGAIMNPGA